MTNCRRLTLIEWNWPTNHKLQIESKSTMYFKVNKKKNKKKIFEKINEMKLFGELL